MAEAAAETATRAEELVRTVMKGSDASHDAAHVFRVPDVALSLTRRTPCKSRLQAHQAGRRRAEKRHRFMEDYLKQFYDEWEGKA